MAGGQRSFFPKADAAVLQSSYAPPTERPHDVGPILDPEFADKAIEPWSADVSSVIYAERPDIFAPIPIPAAPASIPDRYLYPLLTKNERLRLTMLWYYTRGSLEDDELISRLQEKAYLAQESIGWEFGIIGLLDHNTYTRLVTVGLPLAILPRRESTCAHTVNQVPGSIFNLPNMINDWRFAKSPHVELGGLRCYAGAPLRCKTELGDYVALGSLCVASNTPHHTLTKAQQVSLARLADWVVSDIIHSSRARRQRERRHMAELLSKAQRKCDDDSNELEGTVLDALSQVYPHASITVQASKTREILLNGRAPINITDLEHGLWEDTEYLDYFIANLNHLNTTSDRVIRVIATECEHSLDPTLLVVASNDFQLVFDDIDSWFVQACASLLSRGWQARLLREALAAREQFLRGITHQLRTPIHGIIGSVELLAEELKNSELFESSYSKASPFTSPTSETSNPFNYLSTIRSSAKDLISTVNSMIKLNRWAEIAKTDRVCSLYPITRLETELANEVMHFTLDDQFTRPSFFFHHDLPPNCDFLWIDVNLLKDCIVPLIFNAIQATPQGIVAVTVSVTEDYQTLTIDIKDSGCGIDEVDQKRIFAAHEKVDIHTTGAGLGLTLASKMATLISGSITLVASSPGNGSLFRATFNEVACAGAIELPKILKDRLENLPSSFHRIGSSSSSTDLSQHVTQYLLNAGFTSSEQTEDSLVVIGYDPDLEQMRNNLALVNPNQVALCLIPASYIHARPEQIFFQNNIVYVRAPYLPSTFEKALEQADSILLDMVPHQVESTNSTEDIASLMVEPAEVEIAAVECNEDQATSETLVEHIETLHIETKSDEPKPVVSYIPSLCARSPKSVGSRKPLALLVDDNIINLRIMQMYCNKRAIPYSCAMDGHQAVSVFKQNQRLSSDNFNLVLMDLQMPVCDGIEACHAIRSMEQENGWDRCVMFIVTGQDSPSDRSDAEEAGADGYFVKPVGLKNLDRGIAQYFPGSGIK